METPMFAQTEAGVVILTPWPDEIPATREFVETAERRWVQRKGRTLSFTLANGSAVYRIAGRDKHQNVYLLKRVSA